MTAAQTSLPPRYQPDQVERRIYDLWLHERLFHAEPERTAQPYAIVIPPPNVTGALHMGHALNNTLQDILIRWRRMQGRNALWVPGTDHAGIATQNVVEKQLLSEGTSRHEIGREAFTERVWQWKEQFGNRIVEQLKRLGSACDWERQRFTMDAGLTRAVREAFVRLFDQGLIYRGKYLVNWCPYDGTALADDEVEHEEADSHLWHFRYPIKGQTKRFITVATTRPETMLGDTAVAVHPKDDRYTDLIGKSIMLPLMDREIPVIADEVVDMKFGTGAVKVTPAHDPNDFDIGRRHDLPMISVMDGRGVMNDNAGRFGGLDRFDARKAVVDAMDALGLVHQIEPHRHNVGHCYRCGTVVEPFLSDQWFVKMRPLANAAIEASNAGKVTFHPPRWEKVYLSWLENVRDWCISRQIWWGHRIPVWTCTECEYTWAAVEDPERCPQCQCTSLQQDPDVLDTWFSSSLWPFSTLGWPEETEDLAHFYPTSTLVTDRGIIYFWVARMVMMGLRLMRNVPFRDVYIHGTILDELGQKMSKSKGNGIDPMIMIEGGTQQYLGKSYECDGYGADAVRFSLVMLSVEGQDLKLSPTRFEEGRNFTNKVWNAARFCLLKLSGGGPDEFIPEPGLEPAAGVRTAPAGDESVPSSASPEEATASVPSTDARPRERSFEDRWILARLGHTIVDSTKALEGFRFNEAFRTIRRFVWEDFCDWYVELVKPRLGDNAPAADRAAAQRVLAYVLDHAARLLHPLMPFLTEEIWQYLGQVAPQRSLFDGEAPTTEGSIMQAPWPVLHEDMEDPDAITDMERVQQVIIAVRRIREKRNVPHNERPEVLIATASETEALLYRRHGALIAMMGRTQQPVAGIDVEKPDQAGVEVLPGGTQVFMPVKGNVEAERKRLMKELDNARRQLAKSDTQLNNPAFLERANPAVVERTREQHQKWLELIAKLEQHLADL